MAGRPKKSVDNTEKKVTKKVEETVVENKDTEVLADLMNQLKEMQKQIANLTKENEQLKVDKEDEKDEEELTSDTDIPVISLVTGGLTISTEGNGNGTVYRFENFGEIKDIPFGDLKDIVKNKSDFAKGGVYYIANEEAVKKLRLSRDYKNIISDEMFAHLLEEDSKVAIEAYKLAPKLQQEQVVSMIEDRLENGVEVDANILVKIGKLCGRDFMSTASDLEIITD